MPTDNIIYCGDCLRVLKDKVKDESVDLIYLDPPFFSNRDYENFWIKDKATKTGFNDKDWEKLRGSIDPTILAECEAIEERWKGGKKGIYVYIAYMKERLIQCERVLRATGSIYLHCDWHAGHYLKIMMDQVFGYDNFLNEIAWCYGGGGASTNRFARKHDTIFFYSKSDKYIFNPQFSPYKEHSPFHSDGTPYREEGKIMEDWWPMPGLGTKSKEKQGYPTQKPEALLERIIKTSSNKGDLVMDPFCGCGTTLSVAQKLERRFIGVDISRTGCDVTRTRLGGSVRVIGGETLSELKAMDPHDFARWVIMEKMGGMINPRKSGDMGIDGWVDFKTVPVQVKHWGHPIGRPEVDGFKAAIQRDGKDKGVVVGFDFSRGAYTEAARIKADDDIEITLLPVKELLV